MTIQLRNPSDGTVCTANPMTCSLLSGLLRLLSSLVLWCPCSLACFLVLIAFLIATFSCSCVLHVLWRLIDNGGVAASIPLIPL